MKYPYGISDFNKIIKKGYYYCDRTDKIPLLENSDFQLFIRPRRFGKSLLLSMLENYYDVAKKDEFDNLFGKLAIGKKPTKLRNSYYILRWDFSCVDPTGTPQDIKQALHDHINSCIKSFLMYYRDYNLPAVEVDYHNCISSINSLLSAVRMTKYPVYLLIDEYDNFANSLMMGAQTMADRYDAIVYDEGVLKTLFKAVKSATSSTMFDKVFMTGVSPVVLSDITSGYNIAENIYFNPKYNDLCGFKESEVKKAIEEIISECGLKKEAVRPRSYANVQEAIDLMRTYYNGYRFAFDVNENIYNPTLCLYFFKHFQESCQYPRIMLDSNLAVDESKLEYIAQIPLGEKLLVDMMERNHQVTIADIKDRFGIKDMLNSTTKDNSFLVSFLYYFGVLTLAEGSDEFYVKLKVPNMVIQSLFVERIQRELLPEPGIRDDGKDAARQFCQKGQIEPLCTFMEKHYLKVFKNRDYRWANELTIKTAFLTLLYNDMIYIMDSENELDGRYAELTMIIRPDKRHAKAFDILIEFKFISLKDAALNAEKAKEISEEKIGEIPAIKKALQSGLKQVKEYGESLEQNHSNLRLKKFVIIALGFERIYAKQLE